MSLAQQFAELADSAAILKSRTEMIERRIVRNELGDDRFRNSIGCLMNVLREAEGYLIHLESRSRDLSSQPSDSQKPCGRPGCQCHTV